MENPQKHSIITNDVETTSLWNHRLSSKTAEIVYKEGMPLLLEAYKKYNLKATFFFTADIAKLFPDVVRMVIPDGHEVACHGLVHDADQAFDVLTFEKQVEHLRKSKEILENIYQHEIISFRAPALRVNKHTPKALALTGFKVDSSVASQRMDFFLSFGSVNKMRWLTAPRTPYFTDENNLAARGKGPVFEIPLNSFLLPYTGTMMRISPFTTKLTRSMLNFEASKTGRPVIFLIHPNELIYEEIENTVIKRRAKSYISYLLGDKLRYRLKLKNLGHEAYTLLLDQLDFLKNHQFEFITLKDYYNKINKSDNETIST